MAKPQPFVVGIEESAIEDLAERLRRTRLAPDLDNDDWSYGTNSEYLGELVDYWLNQYDWRGVESEINAYDNYRVVIEDVPIHYVRVPGRGPDPTPVILNHGWPWTFWDMRRVFSLLSDPGAHGGDPADALELIVPSLPGYAFSSPLRSRIGAWDVARLFDSLMHDVLGFERYGTAGGDWGSVISACLGHAYGDHVLGSHLTYPFFGDTSDPDTGDVFPRRDYGPGEEGWYEYTKQRMGLATSHMAVHIGDPQTLANALNDSPAGLASWLIERRFQLSDHNGAIEDVYTKDDLCTLSSLYWFTETIGTSMRLYTETLRPPASMQALDIRVPTAVAVFPFETAKAPRAVAERHSNLQRWTVMEAGGHYAPFEKPSAYADDVLAFFAGL
jgi:pimeloyl-ACP methyl ester carboxylesterase